MKNDHLAARETPIGVGEQAPRFTLLNQDREPVSLDDLLARGGDVVLSFYPLDFTSVCSTEMTTLSQDADRYAAKGATIVGISCDSFAAHKEFAQKMGLKIPLLADMHRQVCRAYGFYWADLNVASRGTVVIGPDGAVKWVEAREPGQPLKSQMIISCVS